MKTWSWAKPTKGNKENNEKYPVYATHSLYSKCSFNMDLQTHKERAKFAMCVSKHIKMTLSRSYSEDKAIIISIILLPAMDSGS